MQTPNHCNNISIILLKLTLIRIMMFDFGYMCVIARCAVLCFCAYAHLIKNIIIIHATLFFAIKFLVN